MKFIKLILISILFFINTIYGSAQDVNKISETDFSQIKGTWKGTLTYLDYTTGKPFTMRADIEIVQIGESNKFIFSNSYPDEPNANSADTVTISEDGLYLDYQTVVSKNVLADGETAIITEMSGKDGNENNPAQIRHTYILGKNVFKIKKEILFIGETDWIKRHEFNYSR